MSRLLDEIAKDPSAVFEVEAELPSGNMMFGTVGPLVGKALCCRIMFRKDPASDEDIAAAKSALDQALGRAADFFNVSKTPEEHRAANAAARRFMGGGQG